MPKTKFQEDDKVAVFVDGKEVNIGYISGLPIRSQIGTQYWVECLDIGGNFYPENRLKRLIYEEENK